MAIFETNGTDFNQLTAQGTSIIDFYGTHCGPCRALWPVLLNVQADLPFINIIRVNTEDCPELAEQFGIYTVPTIYLCKDGCLTKYQGSRDAESIQTAIGKLLYQ